MSEHHASVRWVRSGEFVYEGYSRAHELRFDGGIAVPGNAAPANIPKSVPPAAGVDPEQAFIAALSSCHMLWFLHIACQAKFVVDEYTDEASGVLDKTWVSSVTLRPKVSFSGRQPTKDEHEVLHHKAHEKCYIANSVKTAVRIEPTIS